MEKSAQTESNSDLAFCSNRESTEGVIAPSQ
ncbi:hypothetical protein EGR_06201 [Echinococcus granulosus]|uniref:Uncharacterized protein n=1 Tax=Echinococcus granulosus TaxID=6210 RepID=W6ULJ7_ECHGR|nr:hypothetical protein EGR_06201 [Echinococcus granulosus]EUB58982.1 hypothetical protein EGR_06201 [Echinococcus granulosus]